MLAIWESSLGRADRQEEEGGYISSNITNTCGGKYDNYPI